jgi:hypothetical protein
VIQQCLRDMDFRAMSRHGRRQLHRTFLTPIIVPAMAIEFYIRQL